MSIEWTDCGNVGWCHAEGRCTRHTDGAPTPVAISRNTAARIVASFERIVEDAAHAGGGHPDLFDWHAERLAAARERLIRHIIGDKRRVVLPPQPEIDYDR